MRIGGSFPLNQGGSFPISLAGGGYAYLPMGNYLYQLGANTQIQWFDPILSAWRVAANQSSGGALSVDGYDYRIINVTGTIGVATVTGAGSGATNGIGATATGVTVAYSAPAVLGRAARGFAIVGGSLPALVVAQGGSGFTSLPLILIDPPPPGGIQATAVCTLTAGAVATATLVNVGAGYTAIPNVYVVPQPAAVHGHQPAGAAQLPARPYCRRCGLDRRFRRAAAAELALWPADRLPDLVWRADQLRRLAGAGRFRNGDWRDHGGWRPELYGGGADRDHHRRRRGDRYGGHPNGGDQRHFVPAGVH